MNNAKFFIIFTFLLAFAVCVSAQKSTAAQITTKDKNEILKQVFANGFEKLINDAAFTQCTIPIVNAEKIILIETTEPKIFPKTIDDYHFKFMTGKKIEAEVKSNNGD